MDAVPCAVESVLVYLLYIEQCVPVNRTLLIYSAPHLPPLVTVSHKCVSLITFRAWGSSCLGSSVHLSSPGPCDMTRPLCAPVYSL